LGFAVICLQQGSRHFKEEDNNSTGSGNNNNDISGISTRKYYHYRPSVHLFVCLSVRHKPTLYRNG